MELFSSQMVLFQTLSQGPLKLQTSVRQSSCFEGPHHLTGEDRQTIRELLRNTGTRVVNQMGHTREVWSRIGGRKGPHSGGKSSAHGWWINKCLSGSIWGKTCQEEWAVWAKTQRSDASWHCLGMVSDLCGWHVGFESENRKNLERS